MLSRAGEFARLRNAVLVVTAAAWGVLLTIAGSVGPEAGHVSLQHDTSAMNLPAIGTVGGAAAWLLMLVAMMTPALITPLAYLQQRSFKSRQRRSILVFVSGYTGVWLAAGGVLLGVSEALTDPLHPSALTASAAFVLTLLWQCSPAKQHCLNGCHRRPVVPAFGVAADTGALRFGLAHGGWCVGSCWALMLLPLLLPAGHFPAMAAGAVLVCCERLEHPAPAAWRWRGARRVTVALGAQARMGRRRTPATGPLV